MVTQEDDLKHTPTAEENYSESKWFSFYDETHDFWVSSRIGLEPNRARANRWLVVALEGNLIYHDLALNLDLPGEDWDRISVGGLQYQTIDPLARYRIRFGAENVSLDVLWEAVTPVFDYKDCSVPLPPSLAAAHYEQSGKVRGAFHLSSTTYAIDGTGHRDHSWGVRDWEGFHSWVAFMGRFGQDTYFHIEQFHERTTGITRHGFIFAEGENVPLKEAHVELGISRDGTFPRWVHLEVEDIRDHIYFIDGEITLTCPLSFGKCQVGESLGTFSSGGETRLGIIEYGFTR